MLLEAVRKHRLLLAILCGVMLNTLILVFDVHL